MTVFLSIWSRLFHAVGNQLFLLEHLAKHVVMVTVPFLQVNKVVELLFLCFKGWYESGLLLGLIFLLKLICTFVLFFASYYNAIFINWLIITSNCISSHCVV